MSCSEICVDPSCERVIVPEPMLERWQNIVDLLASLASVPAALIMRVGKDVIEVFRTSESEGNPYPLGATEHYYHKCGLYCEHVIRTNSMLLVPDALRDPDWENNPDVPLNMISYLGFPIRFPDATPFGTICVLDRKYNTYNARIEGVMGQFRDVIEFQIAQLCQYHELKTALAEYRTESLSAQDITNRTVAGLQHKLLELARTLEDTNLRLKGEIRERKQTEKELIRAQRLAEAASRAKSEFLANMSHEIRTPLNGIMGMLQLLQATPLDVEQQELTDYSVYSTRRLTNLLSDILDLSRVEAGKLELKSEPMRLRDSFACVEQLFRPAAREKGLELMFHVDPDIPEILLGDANRVQQILGNLVGNAVKFTDAGWVEVHAHLLPAGKPGVVRVLFSVADSGIGISEEKLAVLFDPFEQEHTGRQRDNQGAGLGLAICKKLLALMDGSIAVESHLAKGSTFHFCLPFQPAGSAGKEQGLVPKPRRGKGSILLVEDDHVSRIVAQRHIRALGYDVETACNGEEALRAVARGGFDLVLMDIQMPRMDGMTAIRAIRRGEAGKDKAHVPIAALTAYAMAGDRDEFFEAGADDYLSKPVERDDLAALLERLFA